MFTHIAQYVSVIMFCFVSSHFKCHKVLLKQIKFLYSLLASEFFCQVLTLKNDTQQLQVNQLRMTAWGLILRWRHDHPDFQVRGMLL